MNSSYKNFFLVFSFLVISSTQIYSQEKSGFDNIWNYSEIYKDKETLISSIKLSGRLHIDAIHFRQNENNSYNDILWRRFRFGTKLKLFKHFTFHIEGDFDLNFDAEETYERLTDLYISWRYTPELKIKLGKQATKFTLDGSTSSKDFLTMERSALANSLWFASEYYSGVSFSGKVNNFKYFVGGFTNDEGENFSRFNAKYFGMITLIYDFKKFLPFDKASLRVDYVNNKEHELASTRAFTQVVSISNKIEKRGIGIWSDYAFGKGFTNQSDVSGISTMIFYNISKHIQLVSRYTFVKSSENNGVRTGRYNNVMISGEGDRYNEGYAGINYFIYGHKLKIQLGSQLSSMNDSANDGGGYERCFGTTLGFRSYW